MSWTSRIPRSLAKATRRSKKSRPTIAVVDREAPARGKLLLDVKLRLDGKKLDATNVIPTPRAAAITRIALDHTDRLGPTLVDIAREKAGIAKPGLRIVVGPLPPEVQKVTLYAAGISVDAKEPAAAKAFIAFLASPGAAPTVKSFGLDPITASEIDTLILKMQKEGNIASIVVTHDLPSARTVSDRLVVMRKGRILVQGSFEDLQDSKDDFVVQFLSRAG